MRYSVTFLEDSYEALRTHLQSRPDVEMGAYLIARLSTTPDETRFIVREVIPIADEDIIEQSDVHMKIASISYRRAMKQAHLQKSAFIFVHSHPSGHPNHSPQDDREEKPLFATAHTRIAGASAHASLVFMDGDVSSARVWLANGSMAPIERIRVIGRRFRFHFPGAATEAPAPFFDRQVRAFGPDIQHLLKRLRVGVVGVGGTGSAVAEELIRLGVGELIISDGDTFDASNINRVYGSRLKDQGTSKVDITNRHAADIGLGTVITPLPKPITFESSLKELRNCDLIFGCTDDEWGRSLLTRFAVYYAIPAIDMGVKIDSSDDVINSIQGRVTMLMPTTACLNCRGRISADRVRIESMRATNPEGLEELRKQGYVPELEGPAPAVIAFTSAIASSAVMELLHRLTGCFGEDRNSSEILHLFDQTSTRTNSKKSLPGCYCEEKSYWGRADVTPFLDSTWRSE
jgi:hypothetical protein